MVLVMLCVVAAWKTSSRPGVNDRQALEGLFVVRGSPRGN